LVIVPGAGIPSRSVEILAGPPHTRSDCETTKRAQVGSAERRRFVRSYVPCSKSRFRGRAESALVE
jgi:hypothetical protein